MFEGPGQRRAAGFLVLRGALALAFLLAGVPKLLARPPLPEQFTQLGFPLWFMYLIGLLEVGGGLGLLVRRVSGYAAVVLAVVMLGAAGTLVRHGEYSKLAPSLVFLVLLSGIAYVQRGTFRRLVARVAH
jgi:uncharacterized membrane protein YphA (DoxX/SURF4 family)